MKVLKYILPSLGIITLLFLSMGLFSKTSELKQEYQFKQSREVVFLSLIDPRKMHSWIDGLEKIEPVDGYMNGIGAKYLVTINYGDSKYTILQELVSFQFNEKLGFKLFPPHMSVLMNVVFENKDNSTQMYLNTSITGENLFWRSVLILKKPAIRKIILKDLENLQQLLNTNTPIAGL